MIQTFNVRMCCKFMRNYRHSDRLGLLRIHARFTMDLISNNLQELRMIVNSLRVKDEAGIEVPLSRKSNRISKLIARNDEMKRKVEALELELSNKTTLEKQLETVKNQEMKTINELEQWTKRYASYSAGVKNIEITPEEPEVSYSSEGEIWPTEPETKVWVPSFLPKLRRQAACQDIVWTVAEGAEASNKENVDFSRIGKRKYVRRSKPKPRSVFKFKANDETEEFIDNLNEIMTGKNIRCDTDCTML